MHIEESKGYTVIPKASCYYKYIEERQVKLMRLSGKRGSHG